MAFRARRQNLDLPFAMFVGGLFRLVSMAAVTGVTAIGVGLRVAQRAILVFLAPATVVEGEFVLERGSFPGRRGMTHGAASSKAASVDRRVSMALYAGLWRSFESV
jgi:hypothetical protein